MLVCLYPFSPPIKMADRIETVARHLQYARDNRSTTIKFTNWYVL